MLLPGMNCSERLWVDVEPRLRDQAPGVRIVHGRLDQPSVDACVQALLAGLPERFALAGLSLGGIVAMALVRQAPERVSRLCLMSTNPRPPRPDQQEAWERQRKELATGRTARDLQQDILPVLLGPAGRERGLDGVVLEMADDVGATTLDRQLAAQSSRIDERPALSRVGVPTEVLAADGDALCPVDLHEEIQSLVPGSRLGVLRGSGHLSPLEAPDAVSDELLAWLHRD